MGKYFKRYLPTDFYEMYAQTYSNSDYLNIWKSVFTACELFRLLAIEVASFFEYSYNKQEDENMMKFINEVKNKFDITK